MKRPHKRMKNKEDSIVSAIYNPLTERLAEKLAKLKATPNQVTTFGIFLATIAGFFFALGEWKYLIIGAILTQLILITDLTDGKVARYRNMTTKFGVWYDAVANKIFKYVLFLGITIGIYRIYGDSLILIIGAISIFNITMISFISNLRHFHDFSKGYSELPRVKGLYVPFGLLVLLGISLFALINLLSLFLWISAILGTFVWIRQIYSHYKLGRKMIIKY